MVFGVHNQAPVIRKIAFIPKTCTWVFHAATTVPEVTTSVAPLSTPTPPLTVPLSSTAAGE